MASFFAVFVAREGQRWPFNVSVLYGLGGARTNLFEREQHNNQKRASKHKKAQQLTTSYCFCSGDASAHDDSAITGDSKHGRGMAGL
jgi:hypothetical protein